MLLALSESLSSCLEPVHKQAGDTDAHYVYWESVTVFPSKRVSKNQDLMF